MTIGKHTSLNNSTATANTYVNGGGAGGSGFGNPVVAISPQIESNNLILLTEFFKVKQINIAKAFSNFLLTRFLTYLIEC